MEELGLFETIYSQRQITRYKPDPVPKEVIDKIIEAATKAPSGGNTQPWHFVAITEPELIGKVGGLYRELWLDLIGHTPAPGETPAYTAARYLANHMPEVPAMILVCADHSLGYLPQTQGEPIQRDRYASSIWLAVQNLFLAARALGLGTRLTTTHLRDEAKIKEWLGLPDYIETMCLTPLGYPRGRFGATDRKPAAEVTSYNTFGNKG